MKLKWMLMRSASSQLGWLYNCLALGLNPNDIYAKDWEERMWNAPEVRAVTDAVPPSPSKA